MTVQTTAAMRADLSYSSCSIGDSFCKATAKLNSYVDIRFQGNNRYSMV